MAHGNRNPWVFRSVLACVAASTLCAPAVAGDTSYMDAFDRRVSDIGSRSAMDDFVIAAVNEGQYDQALSTLEEIILRNPSDIGARIALARIYYQISAYGLAAAHIEQALLTAGWEAFEKEIEELKAKIDRAEGGYEYRLTFTAGVGYRAVTESVPTIPDQDYDLTSPFFIADGVVIRDLDTASNDDIRIGGTIKYSRGLADINFDDDITSFDMYRGRAYATYSKGLPDLIDTLRIDTTAYASFQAYGSERTIRDYGAMTEIYVQPSVESQVRVFAGYGWLGDSDQYYTDHRVRYGASGEYRVAPGVALGAYASGYYDWGVSPKRMDYDTPPNYDFEGHGYEVGGAISHLLYVFEDGRSWTHRFGGSYTEERILDYASLSANIAYPSYIADMVDREAWEIYWNHTVQTSPDSEITFGAKYGQEEITDTWTVFDRSQDYWGLHAAFTYQFN